jgi:predicted 3-demethylubiquinone-9 3-methyltransferase (glyoxalase superfamily)
MAASRLQARRRAMQATLQRITPFLWFDNHAEEAVSFYTSIFKNSRVVSVARYGDAWCGGLGKKKRNGDDDSVPA